MRGKILVSLKHGLINYYVDEEVKKGDRVRVISGTFKGEEGYAWDTGTDYKGKLEQVEKLRPKTKMPLSLKRNLEEGIEHFEGLAQTYKNWLNDPNMEWTDEL